MSYGKCLHTWIAKEYEDEEDAKAKAFYTPLDSPSQLVDENEPSWLVGSSQQLLTPHRAKLKLDLHMCIFDKLLNSGPSWHGPTNVFCKYIIVKLGDGCSNRKDVLPLVTMVFCETYMVDFEF
jgi:hypothetical protein